MDVGIGNWQGHQGVADGAKPLWARISNTGTEGPCLAALSVLGFQLAPFADSVQPLP